MSIQDIINTRKIERVVHFTTNKGLVGILDASSLKARSLLSENDRLEFIFKHNVEDRKDADWLDYVNLSVSNINTDFFSRCENWHDDTFWCVLSFSPEILCHEGIYFTDTNNFYTWRVNRAQGEEGLEAIFAQTVIGKFDKKIERNDTYMDYTTTDIQAEVLYPRELSLDYLQKIIVSSEEDMDSVYGLINALQLSQVHVELDVNIFNIL